MRHGPSKDYYALLGIAPGATAQQLRATTSVMLRRLCGPLNGLLACGIARHAEAGVIELFLNSEEIVQGGMIQPMAFRIRAGGTSS